MMQLLLLFAILNETKLYSTGLTRVIVYKISQNYLGIPIDVKVGNFDHMESTT